VSLAGFFFISSQGNTGNGTNNNVFSYVDAAGNTFFRTVNAALNNITFDQQSGTLAPTSPPHFPFAKVTGPLVKPRLPNGRVIPGA
jgi:hypothetical protein